MTRDIHQRAGKPLRFSSKMFIRLRRRDRHPVVSGSGTVIPMPQSMTPNDAIQPAISTDPVIEGPTRLSQSMIWPLMQEYYRSRSIDAWKRIPYFVTSSAAAGDMYSDLIVAHYSDIADQLDPSEPVYVFELAGGSGRFGFYAVRSLHKKWLDHPVLKHQPIRYVMTDFAENNVRYWESHDGFQPCIQADRMDFAVVNTLEGGPVHLRRAGIALSQTRNPIIVIANYLFDTLPHDLFQVNAHQLREGKIALIRKPEADPAQPPTMSKLDPIYDYDEPVSAEQYYPDPIWNQLLASYCQDYYHASVIVPTGALTALEKFKRLSNGRMLLLSSDKGFQTMENQLGHYQHEYSLHDDAFSYMVNYHALRFWFERQGGECDWTKLYNVDLSTLVGCMQPLGPQLKRAIKRHLDEENTLNMANTLLIMVHHMRLDDDIDPNSASRILNSLMDVVRLNRYDPHAINTVVHTMRALMPSLNAAQRLDLLNALDQSCQQHYLFPADTTFLTHVAALLIDLDLPHKALNYLYKAQKVYPPMALTEYLIGLAMERTQQFHDALRHYAKAIEIKPDFDLPYERQAIVRITLAERFTEETILNV